MELWEHPVYLELLVPEDLKEKRVNVVLLVSWVHQVHQVHLESLLVMMLLPSLHFLAREHQRAQTH